MSAFIALQQMFLIFLLMIVGFICYKLKIITKEYSVCLSALVVNIFNPATIFSSVLSNGEGGAKDSSPLLFATVIALFILTILVSAVLARFCSTKHSMRMSYHMMLVFSNCGFIGIPIVKALFGADKLIYVAVIILVFNVLFYTWGTYLVSKICEEELGLPVEPFGLNTLKPLLNMGTLACLLTLIVFCGNITVPSIAAQGVQYLANATTPLSLMIIGASLASQDSIIALFTSMRRYIYCAGKLLILPIIVTVILKRLPLSEDFCQVFMVITAMPAANMNLIALNEKGVEASECSNGVVLSTILSVLTIPVMIYLYPYL